MSRVARIVRTVPVIRAHTAGITAASILRDGKPLVVAAVFGKSFYCRDAGDGWFCFLRDDLEPGPLHALSADWPACLTNHVSKGQTLVPCGNDTMIAPGLRVEFGTLRLWHPPVFPPADPVALRRAFPRLRNAVRAVAPPDTLAGMGIGGRDRGQAGGDWRRVAMEETLRGLAALSRWLFSLDGRMLEDAVRGLMGLGSGLTPTGDDILAGSLLALHAFGMEGEARELAGAVEAHGPERTNGISLAHLRAVEAGQGAAPFHDMLIALMLGEEEFDGHLRRVGAIGHSSGWDALAGIMVIVEYYVSRKCAVT